MALGSSSIRWSWVACEHIFNHHHCCPQFFHISIDPSDISNHHHDFPHKFPCIICILAAQSIIIIFILLQFLTCLNGQEGSWGRPERISCIALNCISLALYNIALNCFELYSISLALCSIALSYTELCNITILVLRCVLLHRIGLNCIALICMILSCTVQYCMALCCTLLNSNKPVLLLVKLKCNTAYFCSWK